MEVGFQVQRLPSCRTVFHQTTLLKIKPFFSYFPRVKSSKSESCISWSNKLPTSGVSFDIIASADFGKRRRRKTSNSKSKGRTLKGVTPKTPVGTSTDKRDSKVIGDEEVSSSTTVNSSQSIDPHKKTLKTKGGIGEVHAIELIHSVEVSEEKIPTEEFSPSKNLPSHEMENGSLNKVKGVKVVAGEVTEEESRDSIVEEESAGAVEKATGDSSIRVEEIDDINWKLTEESGSGIVEEESDKTNEKVIKGSSMRAEESGDAYEKATEENGSDFLEEESDGTDEMATNGSSIQAEGADNHEEEIEDSSIRLEMEENLRKQEIEALAEDNFSRRNKLFVYPSVVKPDQDIEVYFNRSLSTLNNEPDVLIMGAFNDWKWQSFTLRLNKTHLNGDWWACKVHVPKEAYKMDFVFFNAKTLYDNNDKKDFCILVEGRMDAQAFEDFLLLEKRREQEKLAREQEERERLAEEQRQREAERAAIEADRAQAKIETEKKREMLQQLIKKAARSVDNIWFIEPTEFKGGDVVRLYYNKSSGPLAHANNLWIHGGFNNWSSGLTIVENLVSTEKMDGDWWYANVAVPDQAFVLDWVFADGPPQGASVYDNNKREDFHAIVPLPLTEELYWVEEENRLYRRLQEERKIREEAMRAKAEKTARMKAERKERTMKRFLLSQKHIVYTDPLDVQAGSTVTVFYNPANTILNGKPEVWFRGSFNRWTHRNGPLPPQKMLPANNDSHVKATVKVPLDAYLMDFVFSETEEGGIFDNKDGMDYHVPVFGGITKEPPMHVVHVAVEMAPIAKVGGLGDVVTSLSRAVQDLNNSVDIILPKYDCLNLSQVKDLHYQKSYSWGGTEIKVWFGKVEGLPVYFLEPQNGMFSSGYIYGGRNDGERFGFFCHAALEFLQQSGFHPDVIHCHDWSSAPVAWLFKEHYVNYGLSKARIVFTIHNLEFGATNIGKAMAYADKCTTVSPTYSREVAGNPAVAPHVMKFHGILNGIDPDIWDPYNDKFIPVAYTSENVVEGKRAAKEVLQQRLSIKKADLPLVGIITRLTQQKGIHLIKHAIWQTLERNGQVVLLGSAPDPRIQTDFVNLSNQLHNLHSDRARVCLTYDEPLSHLIYAGADFILVPSIFEPCGLTQLTAMRYGSIPVVRKTGGLYDTVFDVDHDKERAEAQGVEPNGFSFDGADAAGVDYALNRAISAWYDGREWFNSLCKTVMEQDWSWNKPALDYMELYHAARK